MKLKSISILPIIFSILASEGIVCIGRDYTDNYVSSSPGEVANFIENNFAKVVGEYNGVSDEKWGATAIENRFEIIIDDTENRYIGEFLDFNQDNGYAVIGKDYQFIDFSITGESPYFNIDSTSYYFSTVSGYMFLYEGEYIGIQEKGLKEYVSEEQEDCKKYEGQDSNKDSSDPGVGKIYDADKYIKDKYGDGWKIENEILLPHYDTRYTLMDHLAVYQHNEAYAGQLKHYYSEGSCWFVSVFNVLQSLADIASGMLQSGNYYQDLSNKQALSNLKYDISKADMPGFKATEEYDPKNDEPNIYYKYYNEDGINISPKVYDSYGNSAYEYLVKSFSFKFPKLYKTIRKYVTSRFESVYDGHNAVEIASIVNAIGDIYGYSFNARGVCSCSEENSAGIRCVRNHLPFIFCTSSWSNGGYGTHAMAGFGYKEYTKEVGWWIFKHTEHKYLYAFVDGWEDETRYFDLSAYWGIGGGIVVLNKNWVNSYNYRTMGR